MKRLHAAAALAIISMTLAACQSSGPIGGNAPTAMGGGGIDGNWVDANGITSSFNSGVFVTRTTDTKEKLAEGSYRYEAPQLVSINMRSLVRGTTSSVNCAVVSPSQLNCTSSAGSQFTLTRKAAG